MYKNFINKQIKTKNAQYKIKYELGKGSYANVFSALNLNDNKYYAVKIMDIRNSLFKQQIIKQIQIQKKFECKNIVKYFDSIIQDDIFFVIMEQGQQSLRNYLDILPFKVMPQLDLVKMLCEIANALIQIHKHNIIHRDIKIENIIIIDGVYKIVDFGIAAEDNLRNTFAGTRLYLAPQIIQGMQNDNSYSKGVDIWALGVLGFEAYLGINPFHIGGNNQLISLNDFNKFLKRIKEFTNPKFNIKYVISKLIEQNKSDQAKFIQSRIRGTNPKLIEFFEKTFQYNPVKRANAQQLLNLLSKLLELNQKMDIQINSPIKTLSKIKKQEIPEQILFLLKIKQQLKGSPFSDPKCIEAIDFLMYIFQQETYNCKFEVIKYEKDQNIYHNLREQYLTQQSRKIYLRDIFFQFIFGIQVKSQDSRKHKFRILICSIYFDVIQKFQSFIQGLNKRNIIVNNLMDIFKFSATCSLQNLSKLQSYLSDEYFI